MINNPQLITEISNRLHQVSTQMSILKSIAWPLSVQDVFFKNNAEKFPIVSYPPFDATPILNEIKAVQKLIKQDDFAGEWLFRISDKLEKQHYY